ncbi:hypothetical protein BDR04DRAFT_1106737 [Suillus decipiens]|nr:hypothetical protein BDR04DRAFT_1106729 [Suillus decipiens]KAG2066427.1 hypothetical protein BDR04DRAFT_1106737 [Suillus decipiens]
MRCSLQSIHSQARQLLSPSDSPVVLSPAPPSTTETEPKPEAEVTDPTALYDLISPPHAHSPPSLISSMNSPRHHNSIVCAATLPSLNFQKQTHLAAFQSALVDRAAYETLWGCCGRTVEGTGDMGPPDGWCYEGRHTVSIISSLQYKS